MKFSFVTKTDIGLKRLDNEDAVGVFNINNDILAIVCDGLGGSKAGEIASQITVETVYKFFTQSSETDPLRKIKSSIEEANNAVHARSADDSELKGMATTVEVLFLQNANAYWGHVGDSRIYLYRNGKIKQLTKDHSLVQKLVDEGHLTYKEAENHPNKNIIMRALGDNDSVEIDLSKLKLNNSDKVAFFICTDGVTAVIRDRELESMLADKKLSPEDFAQKISRIIIDRGAPDNFTFSLIYNY